MKKSILWLTVILWLGTVILAGCNCNKNNPEQEPEVWMANPASVYCEENGGTLKLEDGSGLCMFEDGSYCEEWSYQRWECQPGEIIYNTISDEEVSEEVSEESNNEEVSEEEVNNEEISEEANNEEVQSEELSVAKMRISDDLTQEEIENQINETCGNMWWNWEEGSCVLEDWNVVQF